MIKKKLVTNIPDIFNNIYPALRESVDFMAKLVILPFCVTGSCKSALNEAETKALYIINKRSKELRDQKQLLREKVKKILFDNDDIGITDDDKNFLIKYGINDINNTDLSPYYETEFDVFSARIITHIPSALSNFCDFLTNESFSTEEDDEILDQAGISIEDLYDMKEEDLIILGLSKSCIDEIINTQDFVREHEEEQEAEIERIKANIDKANDFLHKKNTVFDREKAFLYDMKSCVLQISGYQPVSYHKLAHSSSSILAYYIINGFRFHMPVPADDIEDEQISDNEIDTISSDVDSSIEGLPDVHDSIEMLLHFLGLESSVFDDYLNGKGKLPSEMLGITVHKPIYDSSSSSAYTDSCYDDDEYYYDEAYHHDSDYEDDYDEYW